MATKLLAFNADNMVKDFSKQNYSESTHRQLDYFKISRKTNLKNVWNFEFRRTQEIQRFLIPNMELRCRIFYVYINYYRTFMISIDNICNVNTRDS